MGPAWIEMVMFFGVIAFAIAVGTFVGIYFGLPLALKRGALKIGGEADSRSAAEIIRERYARGEISRREYETLRDDLGEEVQDSLRQ